MRCKSVFLLIILVILLVGCTDDKTDKANSNSDSENKEVKQDSEQEEKESDNKKEKKENENKMEFLNSIPRLPEDTASLINQEQGKYGWIDVREDKIVSDVRKDINKLEPLPKKASEEKLNNYFKYMYSLVAEDFPSPKDIVKKWEFGSSGDPDLPDARYHFKENYNIEVILDSSGSMANVVGGKTRMELAKETINNFLKNIPAEANVSLRVYGHKGTGSSEDKKMSCSSIEQVYGFNPYKEDKFQKALDQFKPSGWTPIAAALKESEKALKQFDSKSNTNLIYLVSDGIGTCNGNPVKVAESLSKSNAKPIINIIGFGADAETQAQLQKMAKASEGIYTTVNSQDQLEEEFNRAEEVLEAWNEWKKNALDDADSTKVTNNFDILGLTNKWSFQIDQLTVNLSSLFYIAEEEGIINFNQVSILESRRNDIEKLARNAKSEIEKDLKGINSEKINKLKNSIEEKYSKQTQN